MKSTELILNCITKKYFQLKSRASRKEFLLFIGFNTLLKLILDIGHFILGANIFWFAVIISPILIFLIIPSFTVSIRRLHDMNFSGWWFLILLVFLIMFGQTGFIIKINTNELWSFIFMICFYILFLTIMSFKGTLGPNKYGEPPIN